MELTITWTGGSLTINVEDNSYHYEQVMGDNNLHLTFKTSEYVEIPLGAVVAFQNVSYKLCVPATIKKQSSTSFEIEAVFESPQYALKKYTMREYRYNENSGQWDNSTPSLQFSLTATPLEHLKMIRDNLNRREGDNVWSIGSCITDKEKTLTFDYTNVWDALNNLATEFNTEWRIAGTVLYLGKVEFNKTQPLELSYGKGNGFKSGVGRTNYGDTMPIEVLNVQGTDRNIDPRPFSQGGYGSKRLRLPGQQAFLYEDGGAFSWNGGTTWERYDEENNVWETLSGYTPTNAQSYATDSNGDEVHISVNQQKTHQEANFDGTEIYPCRYGVLSNVIPEQGSGGQTLYNVFDSSIPSNLNYNDCQIAGEEMKIVFQSGMLAGREFAISKYIHSAREFQLVNEEIDGMVMPEPQAFYPQIGDSYAIFGIQLPQAYIADFETHTGASFDMLRAAVKYLHENKNAKYTFNGELDGIFAKNQWATLGGRLRIGEYVSFTDSNFQSTSVLIRIIGVKQYINNPYSPEIEMSNDSIGSTLISEVRKAQAQEVTTEILNRETIRYAKRRFTDAKQTSEALEKMIEEVGSDFSNFSGGISPITVQTMQLLVGSENLQFAFGSIASGVFTKQTISATFGSNKIFTIGLSSGQYLMHYTIGQPKTMTTAASTATMKLWKMPATNTIGPLSGELADKTYYIYAKVKKGDAGTVGSVPSSTANNSFVHSETAIAMDDGQASGYYYFLVGILNAEIEEDRSFAEMFGYSEILPNRITTDKIMSSDPQQGVQIDLVNGTITGNIKFLSGGQAVDAEQYINNTVDAEVGALGVANRNLIGETSIDKRVPTSGTATSGWAYQKYPIYGLPFTSGETLTLQADITVHSGTVTACDIGFYDTSGNYLWNTRGQISGGKILLTFTANSAIAGISAMYLYFFAGAVGATTGNAITISHLKIERGDTKTDWSIAPEDVGIAVDTANAAKNAVDNLEIGGRNLIARTGSPVRIPVSGTATSQWTYKVFTIYDLPFIQDETVWVNAKITVHSGSITALSVIFFNSALTTPYATYQPTLTNGKISFKLTVPSALASKTDAVLLVYAGLHGACTGNAITVSELKVEKGTVATDWTPAPEDSDYLKLALAEATSGTTEIEGGLINTKMIQAGSGSSQAGMVGLESLMTAFFAGGSVADAESMVAPVVIKRDGFAKFGVLFFDPSGIITMRDTTASKTTHLVIKNGEVPAPQAQDIARNNSNNTPTNINYSSFTAAGTNSQANTRQQVWSAPLATSISNKHNGMNVLVNGGTATYTITGGVGVQVYAEVYFRVTGTERLVAMVVANLGSSGSASGTVTIPSQSLTFNASGSTGAIDALMYVTASASGCQVSVGSVQYGWYHDCTSLQTTLADNGLAVIKDNQNFFRAIAGSSGMTTTIKGNTDIPGVLWAGKIASGGGVDSVDYNCVNHTVAGQRSGTGTYKLTLSGFPSNVTVLPTIVNTDSSDIKGCTANVQSISNGVVTIRTFKDNTLTNFAMHVVIFGTN